MSWNHGTVTGYRAKSCRCEPCTSAHRERRAEERVRHSADRAHCPCHRCKAARKEARAAAAKARRAGVIKQLSDPAHPRHGSDTTYTYYGCRCAACTEVHRQRAQVRMARFRDRQPVAS